MKTKILIILAALLGAVSSVTYASTIPIVPSLFDTILVSGIGVSDTSLTLANGTLRDGTALSGYACFSVDEGTPVAEFLCGTASSTSVTSITRGIDPLTGTTSVAALKFAHRRGAGIKITDYPILTIISRIMNGLDTFPNKISYGTTTVPTSANDIAPKSYIDTVLASATSTVETSFLNLTSSGQTVSGNNTYSGINTLSGVNTFSAKPIFSVGATGIVPTSATDVAIKSYVDGVAIAGAPISSNTVTGIGRTASSSQLQSGYSSTTPYFLTSQYSSSVASSTSVVVVSSSTTGKIDPTFIPANSSTTVYTTVGTTTWTKPTGARYIVVTTIGGGGNGGNGGTGTNGTTNYSGSGGGGGGSGALNSQVINAYILTATSTITVGGVNGTSSFGSYVISGGGTSGANGSTHGATSAAGVGGANSGTWTLGSIAGNNGGTGGSITAQGTFGGGGGGGASIGGTGSNGTTGDAGGAFGAGGIPINYNPYIGTGGAGSSGVSSGGGIVGNDGTVYGAGGGGGSGGWSTTGGNGGAGKQGVVIVTTYF